MEPARSSILRISDEKTLELIELYEEEQCLWNTELSSYRNRAKRHAATERIANKLAVEKFDARLVAIKFKNLRNSYCQELKKIATSHALGDDPVYKPRVFWFSKMDSYLRPHLQQLHPWDYDTPQKEEKDEPLMEEPPEELVQLTDPEDVCVLMGNRDSDKEAVDDREVTRKRPRYTWKNAEESDGNSLFTRQETYKNSCRDDCFDSFGRYVSSMLRMMPLQKAMSLQPKIVTLLTSVDFDAEHLDVSQSDDT